MSINFNIDIPEWVLWIFIIYSVACSITTILDIILFFDKKRLNRIERAAINRVQSRNNLDREFQRINERQKE